MNSEAYGKWLHEASHRPRLREGITALQQEGLTPAHAAATIAKALELVGQLVFNAECGNQNAKAVHAMAFAILLDSLQKQDPNSFSVSPDEDDEGGPPSDSTPTTH